MSRIRVQQKHIEIERNVIERFLLLVKDFIRKYRRIVLYSFIGAVVILVIIIAVSLIIGSTEKGERLRYEQLMAKYYTKLSRGDSEGVRATIGEFAEFVDSAHLDFVEDTGPYILGNMYFSEKMYDNAKKYLLKYVNESPETELTPLAMIKAAVACEELNDLNGAFDLLVKVERGYKESLAGEQIYYQLARYYFLKNDVENAKKYLGREVTAYPDSPYAQLARKRLMLLNAAK